MADVPGPLVGADIYAEGHTVAERRALAIESREVQWIRTLLCAEPRGHADMYGGFLVPPDDDGADLGVLFWHKDGFSTACGHGTIALAAWAVASGRIAAPADGVTEVVIDVPSGRVRAAVRTSGGLVEDVTFTNVPSYVHARDVTVTTDRGTLAVDIAFGGAMYAIIPAAAVNLSVHATDITELIATGRQIRNALNAIHAAEHPSDPRLSGIYGTIFTEQISPPEPRADGTRRLHQRNVTVFADGEVDRSPCGSGTSARVALLADTGELRPGDDLRHVSVVGSEFRAWIEELTEAHGRAAVVPAMTGAAYPVGVCRFTVDARDPLLPGFLLR